MNQKHKIKSFKNKDHIIFYKNETEFKFLYDEIFNKKPYYFKITKKKPVIIDCGSHIGLSILYFKKLYPNSKIYSFEPDKENFNLLKKNISENNLKDVFLNNFAISNFKGKQHFYGHFKGSDNDTCGNTLNPFWGDRKGFDKKKINVEKLSTFIKENNIKKIDFLKLDVEGVEEKVIEDIKSFLKNIDKLTLEIHILKDSKKELKKIKHVLKKEGFKVNCEIIDIGNALYKYKNFVKKYRPKIAFIIGHQKNGHEELKQNKKDLIKRLKEINLDISIYKKKPKKYIRLNPRNPITIINLKKKLFQDYSLKTNFKKTNVNKIYESSNYNIGGWIKNKENILFNKNYFIQDLASVICVNELGIKPNKTFLDTCAARGFKTILANDMVKGKLKITAIDIDSNKYNIMLNYFKKFEIKANTKLIDFTKYKGNNFDFVLVDAPCSSEGMTVIYDSKLKKDVTGLNEILKYSQKDILDFSKLQTNLLQNGFNHLKKNGSLIYSTCTLNKIENEQIIEKFLKKNKNAKVIKINMTKYKIKHTQSNLGIRIIPDKTKGFYFIKINKI